MFYMNYIFRNDVFKGIDISNIRYGLDVEYSLYIFKMSE